MSASRPNILVNPGIAAAIVLIAAAFLASPGTTAKAAEAPAAVKLISLDNGDRACYVVVQTAKGQQSLEGDFELCPGGSHDASKLIGRRVTYTTKKAKVMAASCAGNESCRRTDLVDLVVGLTAVAAGR